MFIFLNPRNYLLKLKKHLNKVKPNHTANKENTLIKTIYKIPTLYLPSLNICKHSKLYALKVVKAPSKPIKIAFLKTGETVKQLNNPYKKPIVKEPLELITIVAHGNQTE